MKYTKIALIGFLCASLFNSCGDEKVKDYGPGDATVYFTNIEDGSEPATESIEYTVAETNGLFTIPLKYKGTPGGYPVVVQVTATGVSNADNIDEVAIITSQTIRITENNDSFIQIDPVNRPYIFDDSVIKLTITEVKGANIGKTKECIININNIYSIKYGRYAVEAFGGDPTDWTLILREGPDGQYIAQNFFDLEYFPKLLGRYDAEKKQLVFDGRTTISGNVSFFGQIGWGQYEGYELALNAVAPLVFTVSDDWELASLTGSLRFERYELVTVPEPQYKLFDTPGSILGGGKLTFAGELDDKDWPFEE